MRQGKWLLLFTFSLALQASYGQQSESEGNKAEIHGNFSLDGQYYRPDEAISAVVPDEQTALQGFGNIIYTQGKFEAGMRFETYVPAFVGYPAGAPWSGTGVGMRYAAYHADNISITVGNFYEQFGSGMVLRTWEDRGLGVDYALDGLRVVARPKRGVTLKGLYGRQRRSFNNGIVYSNGLVRGLDAEINLNDVLDSVFVIPGQLTIGGSFVSKFESDRDPIYQFPENVDAVSVRFNYLIGGFNAGAEYARIGINPTRFNSGILDIPANLDPSVGLFQYGQGFNANMGYSRKGLGVGLTANSLSNMAFQSERDELTGFDSWINFLPPTSVLQTALLAQFYPYATQPNGEVAIRADFFYTFKKKSTIGGKYGTKLDLSYTQVNAPDYPMVGDFDLNRRGIEPALFRPSDRVYYADFTARISKKLSPKFKGSLMYMNIVYDNDVIQGAYDYDDVPTRGVIYGNLYMVEGNWTIKRGHNLRFELQVLTTDQHLQDWFAAIVEYTASPHWFISAINQYNYGNADGQLYNFPVLATGYIKDSHRIMLSYGRQRAGVFCVGGVCRVVPASNGLTIGITSSF